MESLPKDITCSFDVGRVELTGKENEEKKETRRQYDRERYSKNKKEYITRASDYRTKLHEDIPRMRAKILKGFEDGTSSWLAKKTMIKYGIVHDKTTKTYS